mmetsp:Transcript_5331/g.11584  ORF Transcript_5331/g.11584 Transcript_5331/m.11584 type:complete len:137 (-) Transcript_5331:537-947(-)
MAAPMDIWRGAGNGAEKRRNACIKEQCCRRSCVAVGQMAKWSFDDDSIEYRRSASVVEEQIEMRGNRREEPLLQYMPNCNPNLPPRQNDQCIFGGRRPTKRGRWRRNRSRASGTLLETKSYSETPTLKPGYSSSDS